jgi:hypothetical protein
MRPTPDKIARRARALAIALLLAAAAPMLHAASSSPTPDQVLVVYNAAWPYDSVGMGVNDSQQVAEYAAARRGIPAGNLLGLTCSTGGNYYYYTGQYPNFQDEVVAPIQAALSQLGSRITVILICYGVPYTVYLPNNQTACVDNVLMGINGWASDGSDVAWSSNPYFDPAPGFDAAPGHFDPGTFTFNGTTMYLVTRLDGPNGAAGAMEEVDQAIYADQYLSTAPGCYQGGVYVDSRYGENGGSTPYTDAFLASDSSVASGDYSGYGTADLCIAWGEHAAVASGLPLHWENTTNAVQIGQPGATYSDGTSALTAPNAILYGGWYNYGTYHDVWGWLPGSVACDLDSDSLDQGSLRSPTSGAFGPSALARGASCVCGVLTEPYLTGHQRPNILLYYMLQGYSFAEAAALCTPTLAWQDVNIGDPLYAPFRAKTPVIDSTPPQPDCGYPQVVVGALAADRTIQVILAEPANAPEVAQATVSYGPTTAYGASANSGQGYWRRPAVALSGLSAGSSYHYQVVLTDPVGNQTTLPDQVLNIPSAPGSAPTITAAAQASPATVTDGTCQLSVGASDAAGSGAITYNWSVLGWGPAPIAVTPNMTAGANQATATFSAIGVYLLRATVIDPSGLSVTSDVTVTVTGVGVGTGTSTGTTTTTATTTTGTTGTATGTSTGTTGTSTTGTGTVGGTGTGGTTPHSSGGSGCGLSGGVALLILLGIRFASRRRAHPRA